MRPSSPAALAIKVLTSCVIVASPASSVASPGSGGAPAGRVAGGRAPDPDPAAPLLPLPAVPAAWGEGGGVLLRLETAALSPENLVTRRWYRAVRLGADGVPRGLPGLSYRVGEAVPEVLSARVLAPEGGRPGALPLRWVAEEGAGPGRRRLATAAGWRGPPGAVLEVLVERVRPAQIGPGWDFAPTHRFGLPVPVARDVFEVRLPQDRPWRHRFTGPPPRVTRGDPAAPQRVLRFARDALAARAPGEPPALVRGSAAPSWGAVAAWYRDRFRRRWVPGPQTEAWVRRSGAEATDDEGYLAAVAAGVADLPYEPGLRGGEADWVGRGAEAVARRGRGNCADRANLLITLLAARDIPATPVLVPRDPAPPVARGLPVFTPGDHVVLRVRRAGRDLFLDPTAPGYAPGAVPPEVAGRLGLDALTGELLRLPAAPDRLRRDLVVTRRGDGGWEARGQISWTGRAAARLRVRLEGPGAGPGVGPNDRDGVGNGIGHGVAGPGRLRPRIPVSTGASGRDSRRPPSLAPPGWRGASRVVAGLRPRRDPLKLAVTWTSEARGPTPPPVSVWSRAAPGAALRGTVEERVVYRAGAGAPPGRPDGEGRAVRGPWGHAWVRGLEDAGDRVFESRTRLVGRPPAAVGRWLGGFGEGPPPADDYPEGLASAAGRSRDEPAANRSSPVSALIPEVPSGT